MRIWVGSSTLIIQEKCQEMPFLLSRRQALPVGLRAGEGESGRVKPKNRRRGEEETANRPCTEEDSHLLLLDPQKEPGSPLAPRVKKNDQAGPER